MTIIGILASIAVPNYQRSVIKAREAVLMEDLYQMRRAIDAYFADHGKYPDSLEQLVEAKYLRDDSEGSVYQRARTAGTARCRPGKLSRRPLSGTGPPPKAVSKMSTAAASWWVSTASPIGNGDGHFMIQLFSVSKTFQREQTALAEVTLQIAKGEFVYLTGPSGAGKSTLLKLICCAERPTRGQILMDGRNITQLGTRCHPLPAPQPWGSSSRTSSC